MGAWGFGPFDNDMAADWVYELERKRSLGVVRAALSAAVGADGYLDSDDGSAALAAAEVVAALLGRPCEDVPEDVGGFIGRCSEAPSPADVEAACAAVERVLGADSELAELWSEAQDDEWAGSCRALLQRLRPS